MDYGRPRGGAREKFWLINMLEQLDKNPKDIISGFNPSNHSESKTITESDRSVRKNFIGGCNILFKKNKYGIVKKSLKKENAGGWDLVLAKNIKGFVCTKPSVVQHIGLIGTMGHNAHYQAADFVE